MISKNGLLDAVWGHRCLMPNVLSQAMTQIRHALGDIDWPWRDKKGLSQTLGSVDHAKNGKASS